MIKEHFMSTRMRRNVMASTLALSIALLPNIQASAADGSSNEILDTLERASADADSVATQILGNRAPTSTEIDKSVQFEVAASGVQVIIPNDASEPLQVVSGSEIEISVELPFSNTASDARSIGQGLTSFDNQNASSTTPIVKRDGSVQIVTIIENANAPTIYDYEIDLPDAVTPKLMDDGGVYFYDDAGEFFGGIAPPWATDSHGDAVPTYFEVDGNLVTQIVEHNARNFEYPIVADPWLGLDIWEQTWYNRKGSDHGEYTVSMLFSTWGWGIYSRAGTGHAIVSTAGWSELVSKRGAVTSKATFKHQFDCHVAFGYAFWWSGFHWDLERWRANKPDWLGTAATHRCNWTS